MHLKTVSKYVRRSPYQAIAAILIMTFTFFIISVFSLLTIFSVRLINYFESIPQLTVFFKDEATIDDISALRKTLEATGKVSSIHYVSKEDALKLYKEQNKGDPLLLDLVTADILPASLEIQSTRAEYLSDLSTVVKDSPIVKEVVFQKDIVDTLIQWTNGIRKIGLVVIAFLVIESIFILLTIIAFKIIIRREEIEIMRLLGATNWFIRMPFIIEGAMYGFFGALIGWTLSYGVLLYVSPFLSTFLKGITLLPIAPLIMLELLGAEVIAAIVLGSFASYMAVLRYLR